MNLYEDHQTEASGRLRHRLHRHGSGKHYDQVQEDVFSFRTAEDRVQEWLWEYGVRTGARFIKLKKGRNYKSLNFDALLAVNYRKPDGVWVWHWVIWDATEKKIRDPQKSDGRKRRYRVDRYLKIYPRAAKRTARKEQSLRTRCSGTQ